MPEWEAFYFHKFFLNGDWVCISKKGHDFGVLLE